MYVKRWLADRLSTSLNVSSVLVVTGARQTGKTTLLENEPIFKDFKYFSLDDLDTLAQVQRDPSPLIDSGQNIIIDEAQREPRILYAIKKAVDSARFPRQRRFILSGSANFLLLKSISETLAGRATYHTLYPFTLSEYYGRDKPGWLVDFFKKIYPEEKEFVQPEPIPTTSRASSGADATRTEVAAAAASAIASAPGPSIPSLSSLLYRGFLPPVFSLITPEEISIWWDGYVKTYLERDLRDLSRITSLTDFRNVMQLVALRTASLIDQTGLSRDTGLSQPTIHRYLNLLEASNLFVRLRPFTQTRARSITKSPKGYFIDPGLACHLAGYRSQKSIDEKYLGNIFESFVLLNLLVIAEIYQMNIYYWRTRDGKEIDFILEYGRDVLPVEVKLSSRVQYDDIRNILYFIGLNHRAVGGVVIYSGNKIQQLSGNVFAIPWTCL